MGRKKGLRVGRVNLSILQRPQRRTRGRRAGPPPTPLLFRAHRLGVRDQVHRNHADDARARTVDIGVQEERNRYDHWQDDEGRGAPALLAGGASLIAFGAEVLERYNRILDRASTNAVDDLAGLARRPRPDAGLKVKKFVMVACSSRNKPAHSLSPASSTPWAQRRTDRREQPLIARRPPHFDVKHAPKADRGDRGAIPKRPFQQALPQAATDSRARVQV